MEKATTKQVQYINYLLKAKNKKIDFKIEDLSIREASKIIYNLKNDKNINTKNNINNINNNITDLNDYLNNIDYDQLKNKYNISFINNNEGWKGSNYKIEFLRDSRKLKKYLNDVIKTEFKNLNYNLSVTNKYNTHIKFELKGKSTDLKKHFKMLTPEEINILNNILTTNILSENVFHSIYDNYFIYSSRLDCLKDGYNKLVKFLNDLFKSFSYDYSDIMTDYFDYGLIFQISLLIEDKPTWEEEERFIECLKAAKNEDEIISKYPFKDIDEKTQEVINNYLKEKEEERQKKIEEIEKNNLKVKEEERKREEERKTFFNENNYIINDLEEPLIIKGCRFSTFNKPVNYDEAIKFIENYPENKEVGTIAQVRRIIEIKNKNLFEYIKNNLLINLNPLLIGGGCCWCHYEDNQYKEVDKEEQKKIYYSECSSVELAKKGYYFMRECVLIRFDGEDQFLIDPSGFNYCRYFGLMPLANYKEIEKEDFMPILSSYDKNIYNKCLFLKENESFDLIDFGVREISEDLKTLLNNINVKIIENKYSINFKKILVNN